MIVTDAKNTWGSAGSSDVLQRTDLWQVDFSDVVRGLNGLGRNLAAIEPWDAKSVTLPQKQMKVEPVRRDSRSYNMPSFDEPLEASKVVFWFSSRKEAEDSKVFKMLTMWWHQARAGRGSISPDAEFVPDLDQSYQIRFRWNVGIALLKGAPAAKKDGSLLVASARFRLTNAWLSGFKVSDLSYEQGNQIATIEATLQAESLERV